MNTFRKTGLALLCLYAGSVLPKTASVENPVFITQDTTIELTEDIIISSKGSPFIATGSFGQSKVETLIITSQKGCAIIVSPQGLWDISSFNSSTRTIVFRGNARLVLQPGAHLHGLGTTLIFAEQSRIE